MDGIANSRATSTALPELPVPAFIAAHYRVDAPHGTFTIRIGAVLDADTARCAPGLPWAVLTACNPGAAASGEAANARATADLVALLDAEGTNHWPGLNHDGQGGHAEASRFVAGLDTAVADHIARRFGQAALVAGVIGGAARLRMLVPRGADGLVDTAFVDWVASGTPAPARP
jgi:hypothetical protein